MKVIFTQGLPASGKSTWAKNYCIKNKDWVRVSRDDLRNMRGQYWIPKDEKLINRLEFGCIIEALSYGKNVIVDATNLNKKYLSSLKFDITKIYGPVQFEIKVFDTSLEQCIKRDLKRENSVGEKVIRGMYDKYLNPIKPIKQNKKLPWRWIVDLDGTVAIHNGRSPFEYEKCDTDLKNEPISNIVNEFLYCDRGSTPIIYMSGRDDSCREKTLKWLEDNGLWSEDCLLYMRKTGDTRKDWIVKKELFDEHIKDKYYVEVIWDDRNQVVKMWRDLGLTCLQVAEGDF